MLFLFISASCGRSEKVPDHVIVPDQMVSILVDVHLLESRIDQLFLSKDSSRVIFQAYEQQLFEQYDVTEKQYRESYMWYFDNVRMMESLYGRVVDSLLVRQQSKKF